MADDTREGAHETALAWLTIASTSCDPRPPSIYLQHPRHADLYVHLYDASSEPDARYTRESVLAPMLVELIADVRADAVKRERARHATERAAADALAEAVEGQVPWRLLRAMGREIAKLRERLARDGGE